VRPFTAAELDRLLAATWPRWRPALAFAAATGLRRGELCGLRWDDWDATTRTLQVQRQVVVGAHGVPLLQPLPKTAAGFRTFKVSARAAAALDAQAAQIARDRQRFGRAFLNAGWVFPTHAGTLIHPRNLSRAYEAARGRAGLRAEDFHALRHHAVSVMLGAGVPLHVVSKRIGHSSQLVTSQTYGHLLTEHDEQAAALLDAWDARD
jgi:integrase